MHAAITGASSRVQSHVSELLSRKMLVGPCVNEIFEKLPSPSGDTVTEVNKTRVLGCLDEELVTYSNFDGDVILLNSATRPGRLRKYLRGKCPSITFIIQNSLP